MLDDERPLLSKLNCPTELTPDQTIEMEHGAGGRKFQRLLQNLIKPCFGQSLQSETDSAVLSLASGRIALTTDTYVVDPIFFPGGNIGSLAVHGTVNDLAMVGAVPRYLTCGLVVSEGISAETIQTVLTSMKAAADAAKVSIVTGDTKVIERRHGDDLFINTAGVGDLPEGLDISPRRIASGDSIIVSGAVGNHGATILAIRDGLEFETDLQSDSAPLHFAVQALLEHSLQIHCMRDITRGGLTSSLVELSLAAKVQIDIQESAVPVDTNVKTLCRVLGLDPMHLACEGRFLIFCPQDEEATVLRILGGVPETAEARVIGRVSAAEVGQVFSQTLLGARRRLELPVGLNLPRIC